MAAPSLVLRDIHQTAAPSWWPPAPGWWVVAAIVLALVVAYAWWRRRETRRRRAIAQWFDRELDSAESPAGQIAAMSELLRRAGRRRDARADRLHGEEWLAFLDDVEPPTRRRRASRGRAPVRAFSEGEGRLLLDGAFRRDVDAARVDALRRLSRERFLRWMGAS